MNQELYFLNKFQNHSCTKLPPKPSNFLDIRNYLSEFLEEDDKALARSNLGITPLLEELKDLIDRKVILTGAVQWDTEPTPEHTEHVLDSDSLYRIFNNYYTKSEINDHDNLLIRMINDGKITVDSELNINSPNAVLNLVITDAINGLYTTFDSRVTTVEDRSVVNEDNIETINNNLNTIINTTIPTINESLNLTNSTLNNKIDNDISTLSNELDRLNGIVDTLLLKLNRIEDLQELLNWLSSRISRAYLADENGNIILDDSGNPIEIVLTPTEKLNMSIDELNNVLTERNEEDDTVNTVPELFDAVNDTITDNSIDSLFND